MTIEERFERIEHLTAGLAEERRKDREEYKQLWRDTQRQIDDLTKKIAKTNETIDRFAEESREAHRRFVENDERLREQMDASDRRLSERIESVNRQLDERINSLVSAIGAYIAAGRKPENT